MGPSCIPAIPPPMLMRDGKCKKSCNAVYVGKEECSQTSFTFTITVIPASSLDNNYPYYFLSTAPPYSIMVTNGTSKNSYKFKIEADINVI